MNHKAVGFWIGAVLLGAGACAHGSNQAQNNNPANNPQPQAVATGQTPDDQQAAAGNNGAATGAQAGMSATNDTTASTTTPDTTDNTGTTGATQNGTQNPLQQRNDIISNADGSQPGVIQDYSYGELTLTPSGSSQAQLAPKNTSVMAIGDSVPVFQGTTRVGTEALVPGTDVRVYYKNPSSGAEKQITGVDILAPATNQNVVPTTPNMPSNLNQDMNQRNPSDSNSTGTTPDTNTTPAPDNGQ